MFSNESQSVVGDVIEHEDGSRYVVLPGGLLAYLGNRQLKRSTGLLERSDKRCRILGRMALLPYVPEGESEMDDIETDWDMLRARERIPVSLPKGCTCGHDALTAVLTCEIHEVRMRPEEGSEYSRASQAEAFRFIKDYRFNGYDFQKDEVISRLNNGEWPEPFSNALVDLVIFQGGAVVAGTDIDPENDSEFLDAIFGAGSST
jgi:hypothetical protein